MFMGVYLLLSLIVFILTLFLRSPAGVYRFHKGRVRPWQWYYTGLSLLLVTLCFAGFIALTILSSILFFGVSSSYSIPQDYIKHGLIGWIALFIGAMGILSPLIAARIADQILIRKS